MPHKLKHTLYIVVMYSLSLFFTNSCSSDNTKQAVRQSLSELVDAVEAKKYYEVRQKFTKKFQGNAGFNQRTMVALIFRYTLGHKHIKIYKLINDIEINENKHTVKMLFHILLTSTKNTLPEHMRAFRIQSKWGKIETEWKITQANWIEVRPQSVYPQVKHL